MMNHHGKKSAMVANLAGPLPGGGPLSCQNLQTKTFVRASLFLMYCLAAVSCFCLSCNSKNVNPSPAERMHKLERLSDDLSSRYRALKVFPAIPNNLIESPSEEFGHYSVQFIHGDRSAVFVLCCVPDTERFSDVDQREIENFLDAKFDDIVRLGEINNLTASNIEDYRIKVRSLLPKEFERNVFLNQDGSFLFCDASNSKYLIFSDLVFE